MKNKLKQIVLSPVTHFNIIIVGFAIVIQSAHFHAHHVMETDVNSYVRNFCRKNQDRCKKILYID